MAIKKGNEDLKAKIAKIQNKGKSAPVEVPEVADEEDLSGNSDAVNEDEDADMKALNEKFEAEKKALMEKAKKKAPAPAPVEEPEQEEEPAEDPEQGIEQAITEYSDDGKFRVETIFQAVQINTTLKSIDASLKVIAESLKELVKHE